MNLNSTADVARARSRHAMFVGFCIFAVVVGVLVQFLLLYPLDNMLFFGAPIWLVQTIIPAFAVSTALGSLAVKWYGWRFGSTTALLAFVATMPVYHFLVAIYTIG